MTLGQFVPKTRVAGDKIDLRNAGFYNRPYLIQAQDYTDSFHSKMSNNGQGATLEAVWADVMDVQTGTILINVLFTNGAIVDNLKEQVGTGVVLPVKIVKRTGGKFGGYAALAALDGAELAQATAAYQNWGQVTAERARREAAAQPQGVQGPFQPGGSLNGVNVQQGGQAPAPGGMFGTPAPQADPFQGQQAPVQQPFPNPVPDNQFPGQVPQGQVQPFAAAAGPGQTIQPQPQGQFPGQVAAAPAPAQGLFPAQPQAPVQQPATDPAAAQQALNALNQGQLS
ncbi:MAG TPA: hypothetical protein VHU81_06470 [Thermoanaerobaculia bacterium]|jgi:hypothetical protein|nr:hypothetical protein [Thermoanaerobaculia bacterium]